MSESTISNCCLPAAPGTFAPSLAPYVVSIQSLYGIVSLGTLGGIVITTQGNTIYFSTDGTAGLGTVTSVQATSSNSNLTVTGGPVTVAGTFTFDLAGNLDSISGLVMAADEMLYSTGAATFATTGLTAFGRSLINDANAAAAQTTLGLVIGTNVQAWSADLDTFVANTSWSSGILQILGTGGLFVEDTTANNTNLLTASAIDPGFTGNLLLLTNGSSGSVVVDANCNLVVSGDITTSGTFNGNGSLISGITFANVTGTVPVAQGGTNITSYAVGDLIYASGATTLAKLPDVAAGAFLRSGGVATAPAWSTTLWPNTLVTGDILYASSTTQVSRLANVATGNVLLSGGIGVASAFGKVTSAHVNNTIPTMTAGVNSDITVLSGLVSIPNTVGFGDGISVLGSYEDSSENTGNSGDILTSTVGGTAWSNQITLDTLTLNTSLSLEATITAGGTTGNQVINKPAGTVNMAAASGTAITVTNSLVTANSLVHAFIRSNDTTAEVKNVVPTAGAFTINLTAAATAETSIGFIVVQPS